MTLGRRLMLIGMAVLGMLAALLWVEQEAARRGDERARTEPVTIVPAAAPIASEAAVFQPRAAHLALDAEEMTRRPAPLRTLARFRAIRAYPGAPPRVPHGLTEEEFRTGKCGTCHERGGYSPRFRAYAPVTPHPEWTSCLQCHPADAMLIGLALPEATRDAVCRQCHAPDASTPMVPSLTWQPAPWPTLARRALHAPPPPIPHPLDLRGDCLACHSGPAAGAEIRTTHPERRECRQCHTLASEAEGGFVRPPSDAPSRTGGWP